jgi:transketolase
MRKTSLDMVFELAQRDPRVVFVGSDLGVGTLKEMKAALPDRFFMEGVAEQNIIGMAAGLAMDGYIPYVNTIATFLTRRCYEQVAVDLCLQNLPVRLIGNGGGLVYAPLGSTHLAIEDCAILSSLPNMTVIAPSDAEEMKHVIPATLDLPGPCYIRLGKGGDPVIHQPERKFTLGKAVSYRLPGRYLIVSTGVMTARAIGAADILTKQGIDCGVMHLHTLKPLDESALLTTARRVDAVITVEEHVLRGGLGSCLAELFADRLPGIAPALLRLGIPDKFPDKYGSQDDLLKVFGLLPEQIAGRVAAFLARVAEFRACAS